MICQHWFLFYGMVPREVISVKPLKARLSITLDEDIAQKIRDLAEKDDRSLSQYINLVLRQHLLQKGEK